MNNATVQNLQDQVRRDLIPLATAPVAVIGFIVVLLAPDDSLPSAFTQGLLMIVLTIAVLWLRECSPDGAAWVLSLFSCHHRPDWRVAVIDGVAPLLVVPVVMAAITRAGACLLGALAVAFDIGSLAAGGSWVPTRAPLSPS